MSSRRLVALAVLVTACGGSAPGPRTPTRGQLEPASGRLTLHGDAAAFTEFPGGGFRGAFDVGFESTGCCGLAIYAAHTSRNSSEAAKENATEVLDGGLELDVAPSIAAIDDRLRMRVRAGKAATPPYLASAGRPGFAASAGLLVRVWDVQPPAVNRGAPNIDFLAEYYGWSLGREQTSAGPREDSSSIVGGALVLGVRVGLDYGVELK